MANLMTRTRAGVFSLLAAFAISSCGSEGYSTASLQAGEQGGMSLTPPPLLQSRMINRQALSPVVTMNGTNIPMTGRDNGAVFSGNARIAEGSAVQVVITWTERVGIEDVRLLQVRRDFAAINRNEDIVISDDEYDGSAFDDDEDGISNINERLEGTRHNDASDPGTSRPQVFIPYIQAESAPTIDGEYDTIWNNSQFRDRDRNTLSIDNLMVDQRTGDGGVRGDGNAEFQWSAMHDGEYLYIFAFGELADRRTPFNDSTTIWHDDNLDLFIDGDNSKLSAYDGVNDYHMLMPILKSNGDPNRSGDVDTRFEFGSNSIQSLDGLDFAACQCDDRDTMEIRVRLADVGIDIGHPFGIELQYGDDIDGGDRDAKWGWRHPSRITVDVDNTWRDPSFMGTAQLDEPPP